MTTLLETALSLPNACLLIIAGDIAHQLQKSASTALENTERYQTHTPPSRKPALKKSIQNNNVIQASSSSNSGFSNRAHAEAPRHRSMNIATRSSSTFSSAANYISYEDSFNGYMCHLYASQQNQSIPGTFQDVFIIY